MNHFLYLIFVGILSWLFAGISIKKSSIRGSQYYLAALLFFLGLISISIAVVSEYQQDLAYINFLSLLFYVACLCLSPTMYLYIHRISVKVLNQDFKTQEISHFFPAIVLFTINCISFFIVYTSDENSDLMQVIPDVMTYSNFIALIFVFPIQLIYYIYKSILLYLNHKKKISEIFSFEDGVDLKWLKTFIIGFVVTISSILFIQVSKAFGTTTFISLIAIYIAFIFYKGFTQKEIETESEELNEEQHPSINSSDDQKGWDSQKSQELKEFMKSDKPYLIEDLTIYALAKALNTNTKYLSKLINSQFDKNFKSFINSYRVEEVKLLLANSEYDKYTLETLAKEVGFNSRSAFTRAFKKEVGLNPSEFKSQLDDSNPTENS